MNNPPFLPNEEYIYREEDMLSHLTTEEFEVYRRLKVEYQLIVARTVLDGGKFEEVIRDFKDTMK